MSAPGTAQLRELPALTPPAAPLEVLRTGLRCAGGAVALACSFSMEDVLLVALLHELGQASASEQDAGLPAGVSIIALDTGRLPEETYEVAEALCVRYGVSIDWYCPDAPAVERLLQLKGPFSFRNSLAERQECCGVRKVEPLQRALRGQAGWITGQRRQHGLTRAGLLPLERDAAHGGILKINPLCDLSDEAVWAEAEARALPRSRLYARGYSSIGCAPCTRAVAAGEPARAGRWWWEAPEHKECGLHRRHP